MPRRTQRAESISDFFTGQKILIIHSGGDSRRLPAYAAQGKVFLPLPRDTREGRAAAMFDLVFEDLAAVELPDEGRVFVATGDVLLGVSRHGLDLSKPGIVGVAFPTDPKRGSRHGVYVADEAGNVTDFLQKPDEATAAARGAIDARGRVLVDMGLLSLDPPSVERWLGMAGAEVSGGKVRVREGLLKEILGEGRGGLESRPTAIDLYEQVLIAVAPRLGLADYLETVVRTADEEEAARLRSLLAPMHRALHATPFQVAVVPESDFVHVGTTRELLETVPRDKRVRRHAPEGHSTVYNSVTRGMKSRGVAVVEACEFEKPVSLGGENVLVGWPRGAGVSGPIPKGWGAVCLPIGTRDWSVALFGVDDDCKTPRHRGGTFGGQALDERLRAWGLTPDDLWRAADSGDQTLWTARLWRVGTLREVMKNTLWIWVGKGPPRGWRERREGGLEARSPNRHSFAELITRVNHARLTEHREELQRRDRLARVGDRVAADRWIAARRVVEDVRESAEAAGVLSQIGRVAAKSGALERARLWRMGGVVQAAFPRALAAGVPRDCGEAAFAEVARAVAQDIELPRAPRKAAIPGDQVVWVTTPVRIDFAGGWSDTPPVCHELGGAVVNGAITLNGQYPVQVIARLSEEPRIRISSVDLGDSVTLRDAAAVLDYCDPRDWAAIAKAALVLSGVAPPTAGASLTNWLKVLGGGLDLTMFSALPKGSGLGTSSALGAALLACLGRVHGREPDTAELITRTSLLEQMMSTAGGWQDQSGGITPGVKLLRTEPGMDQRPSILPLPFESRPGSELASRMLLYYTGYRRLAADILHGVVGRYLERDPGVLDIIARLKACAGQMKEDLARGDVDGFARGVLMNWELKKAIDPGSTNAKIEGLFGPLKKYLSGYELPGAGGGGFLFMIARDEEAARVVRTKLTRNPPNALARFYEFAMDLKGLSVAVL